MTRSAAVLAAKVEVLRQYQQLWEAVAPDGPASPVGRAMRRVIALAFKAAADDVEQGQS